MHESDEANAQRIADLQEALRAVRAEGERCPWRTDTSDNIHLTLAHAADLLARAAAYHAPCGVLCTGEVRWLEHLSRKVQRIADDLAYAHRPKPRVDDKEAP